MKVILVVALILVTLIHLFVFPSLLDWGTNIVTWFTNLFALFHAILYFRKFNRPRFVFYVLGYLLLLIFFLVLAGRPLMFILFAVLYAASYRIPFLFGYYLIFLFSTVFLTPYWAEALVLFSLFYTGIFCVYRKSRQKFLLTSFSTGLILLFLVLLPVFYLVLQTTPQTLLASLKLSAFQKALFTSLFSSTVATIIVLLFGVPLAYAMARLEFPGKRVIDSLIDLPILIPQTVAGIALLVLLGPKTPVGEFFTEKLGIHFAGSYLGIIAAQVFVSSPFLIRSAMNAFYDIDPRLENVSRTLGASPFSTFMRISLPMASAGIFNGCILTWARAISEVGSLIVLSYHPMTVSIYNYDIFIQFGLQEATPVAALLVIFCLWIFLCLRWLRHNPIFHHTRS